MRAPLKFELDRRQGVLNIGYGAGSSPTFTNLTVTGVALFADGTAAAPSISFAADSDTGFYRDSANLLGFSAGGAGSLRFGSAGTVYGAAVANYVRLNNSGAVEIVAAGTNQNITLTPSGTGGLVASSAAGQRVSFGDSVFLNSSWGSGALAVGPNGVDKVIFGYLGASYAGATVGAHNSTLNGWTTLNYAALAHTFRISETLVAHINVLGRFIIGNGTTDSGGLLQLGATGTTSLATNGIVFATDTSIHRSGAGFIRFGGPQTTGGFDTGSAGYFGITNASGGGCDIRFLSAGSTELRTNSTLALTLDASQNATFAGSVTAASAANFTFSGRSYISSPADSVIRLLNNAGTDFDRLQFGGTSASFPGLRRSGATLEVILANASAYATIAAATHVSNAAAVTVGAGNVSYGGTTATTVGAAGGASALPATPTGYIIINVAGTPAKLPYYAA